jgi:hypothetical protein
MLCGVGVLAILAFSAHHASLQLTSYVKGRCQAVGRGGGVAPITGHLTTAGVLCVRFQSVLQHEFLYNVPPFSGFLK